MATNGKDLVLAAIGDLRVIRSNPETVFVNVADLLRKANITIANLEAPTCNRGEPIPGKREVGSANVRASPKLPPVLPRVGIKVVSLANNHVMDYGAQGLFQTIELLDGVGVAHAGAGHNLREAHAPAIIECKGTRVAFLSFTSVYPQAGFAATEDTPGASTVKIHTAYQVPENIMYQPGFPPIILTIPEPHEAERILDDIRQAKKAADIVVLSAHWGVSWGYGRVAGYQRELGHAAIDAGADLVIGLHAHSLQGMEVYKGRCICYCLGNFAVELRGMHLAHHRRETAILLCYIRNKQIYRFSLRPLRVGEDYQPVLLNAAESAAIAKALDASSEEFGTTFTQEGEEIIIGGPKPGTPEPLRGIAALRDEMLPVPPLDLSKLGDIE